MCLCFVPEITNRIKTTLTKNNMSLVCLNNNKLRNSLGSKKDKIDISQKADIYSIECKDCKRFYYGQTKRSISTRFKEHSKYIAKNQERKSTIAAHDLTESHCNVPTDGLRL